MPTVNHATVSVIVPVFNGERHLAEAIGSIIFQDYQPLEVLVVDDGSTDGSAVIAEAYSNVTVLRKQHSGLGATLNLGIRNSSGGLLAFLDADDRWLPGKLSQQCGWLAANPDVDMVFSHVRTFGAAGETDHGAGEGFSGPMRAVSKISLLIRRESFLRVGYFSEQATQHDFLEWYARAMDAQLKGFVMPEVFVERRVHAENVGRQFPAQQKQRYLNTLQAILHRRQARERGGG